MSNMALCYIVDMGSLRTDYLVAQPSFLSGMARLFDLFGLFDSYKESRTSEEADAVATYLDWRITGEDIRNGAHKFQQELSEEQNKQLLLFAK